MIFPGTRRDRTVYGGALVVVTAAALSLGFGLGRSEGEARVPEAAAVASPSAVPESAPEPTPVVTAEPTVAPEATRAPGRRPAPPAPPLPPAARPGARPDDPAAEQRGDVLKRQDPLPPGVREQLEFFVGGGSECGGQFGDVPEIAGVTAVQEIPSRTRLCFLGFNQEQPLALTIVEPGGRTLVHDLTPPADVEADFLYRFPRTPGERLGDYHVRAVQGEVAVTLDFTVRRATAPRIWVDHRPGMIPGDDVHVFVGGFPPNRTVDLLLYGGEERRYRTSIPVSVDGNGEGHVVLDTKLDDAVGCYGVTHPLVYAVEDEVRSLFCLRNP
ncbi:hypothetical protein [Asanoa siamensis]|uniref:Secreted protein n=1 Tax=Asanoa siamensis TaxID=926357 RepID=A0ABQ4CW05_9ACTN|nr:hypothetical protein [Asanoa siamensis]GIF75469.1 hypothetical protein Asi02nite_49870 [Asanoa siamensis]